MQRLRFVTLCYANYGNFFLEIHQNHQEKVMHFWCTFESASKVHQNPMKVHQKCIIVHQKCIIVHQKCIMFLKILMIFSKKSHGCSAKFSFSMRFHPNSISVLKMFCLNFPHIDSTSASFSLRFHCTFENASQVQLFLWGLSLIASWLHFQKCNQSVMDFGKFSHCMSPTKFHWRAAH